MLRWLHPTSSALIWERGNVHWTLPKSSVQTLCTKSTSSLGKKQRDSTLFPSFWVVLLEFILVSSGCPHARHRTRIQAGEINLMERFLMKHTKIKQPHQLQVWSSNKRGPGRLKGVDHQILKKVKETAYKAQDTEQYLDKTRIISNIREKRLCRIKHLSIHRRSAFQENLHSTLFPLHVLSQDFKGKIIMFAIIKF